MKLPSVSALAAATLVCAAPASAHEIWIDPAPVVIDIPVWVNPGVYVSQYSAVTRNYPYVGCCLPPIENWNYARPYPSAFAMRTRRIDFVPALGSAHRRVLRELAAGRPPALSGRKTIERFR